MNGDNVTLAAVAAVILSLLVEWFPGVREWWEGFTESQKRGIMAGAVALLSIATVAVGCARGTGACPADWLAFLVEVFLTFLAAASVQQGVHLLTKRTPQE